MPIDDAYLEWLYQQVVDGGEDITKVQNIAVTYWDLLVFLHSKEFTWTKRTELDENRASDGRNLRHDFLAQKGRKAPRHWLDEPCSMLELLVSLAWKMEFDSPDGETQAHWFWTMIANIGLNKYTDARGIDPVTVNDILDRVIERRYSASGKGGLFPLAHAEEDQRGVELHYQAEAYLQEHAPII